MKTPYPVLAVVSLLACTGAACAANTAKTGPTVSFSKTPAQLTRDRYAQFEFAAPGADHWFCTLDGAPLAECASPLVLMPRAPGEPELAPGSHTLTVRAALSGVWGAPARASWKIVSVLEQARNKGRLARSKLTVTNQVPPVYTGVGENDKTSVLKGIARFKCLNPTPPMTIPSSFPVSPAKHTCTVSGVMRKATPFRMRIALHP